MLATRVPAPSCAPRILPVGEAALSVEFGDRVAPEVNAAVLALDALIAAAPIAGVVETVPTYRALLVHFDPLAVAPAALETLLAPLAAQAVAEPARAGQGRLWHLPVAYGGAHGIDLATLAARHGMAEGEVVRRHSAEVYRVYMLGFAPGFAYLGALPAALVTPRRAEPRLTTPAGSVSIGGAQTAVTSMAVPSGWHLIGRTPVPTFTPAAERMCLFEPGDRVQCRPIAAADFEALAGRIARGEYGLVPEPAS
ncbi:MAG: 5-oxoprolinase subunit PxpB [Pseudomonadota bacterium]